MLVYVDRSTIRPGKLEQLSRAAGELAAFVTASEPRLLSYGFFLDPDAGRVSVVAVHPDSASLELHFDVAGARFAAFAELLELERIDVYGEPGERLLELLREKAALLGRGSVVVHRGLPAPGGR